MSNDAKPPLALEREIETYRRELPRLLATGQAGRFILIKGEQILGIWNNQADAIQFGRQQFGLEPFAVKTVDARDLELLDRMDAGKGTACPA
jgi:hypothetical protein